MKMENKVIWILSPNRWGKMKVSKHHYALTLAARNNTVYFIEPPSLEEKGIKITNLEGSDKIFIVSYKPRFRGKDFLPRFFYKFLLHRQIGFFRKEIPQKPDVIWCFAPFVYENLQWFKAPVNILHVMDFGVKADLPPEAKTSDVIFGVSASILDWLRPSGIPLYFLNHGLGKAFAKKANLSLKCVGHQKHPDQHRLKVGYIGNLLMEAPDRSTMISIIRNHPDIDFVFWGQYENDGSNNLGSWFHGDVPEFINFLKNAPNVILKGSQESEKIQEEIDSIDMFWICWKVGISKLWDGSNSHKILEYLSTGKPVIAHHIKTYENSNLFYMLPTDSNENYEALFDDVVEKIKKGEDPNLIRERIEYALNNTYDKQVDRIEEILNGVCSENKS
ncbi:MAG: hypothetical protein C5B59_15050 [Bacteroidetes bacterium]|nr:MAG: hypothetical protein C5B59_15050 [Bacteroidota bacterium]